VATLITGGTGLIGLALADRLVARGDRVVLFDRAVPEAALARVAAHGDRLHLVPGDVQALGELMDAVRRHGVEAIVHLAFVLGGEANLMPERATRVNILGTVNALEAARLGGVARVLLASSIAVYGSDDQYPPEALPLREDVPRHVCRTLPIYGGGKLHTEHLAQAYAEHHRLVVGGLRPSVVYGAGRERGGSAFLNQVIDRPALGQTAAVGLGDARVSFVSVEDVAEQYVSLLDADPAVFARRRFFNTGGDTATVRELAETVRRIVPEAQIAVTSNGAPDLGGLASRVSDRSLEEEVGHRRRFTPLEVGVRAQIAVTRARAGLPPLPAS
jgi:UDP-glucose 4-epimerase